MMTAISPRSAISFVVVVLVSCLAGAGLVGCASPLPDSGASRWLAQPAEVPFSSSRLQGTTIGGLPISLFVANSESGSVLRDVFIPASGECVSPKCLEFESICSCVRVGCIDSQKKYWRVKGKVANASDYVEKIVDDNGICCEVIRESDLRRVVANDLPQWVIVAKKIDESLRGRLERGAELRWGFVDMAGPEAMFYFEYGATHLGGQGSAFCGVQGQELSASAYWEIPASLFLAK